MLKNNNLETGLVTDQEKNVSFNWRDSNRPTTNWGGSGTKDGKNQSKVPELDFGNCTQVNLNKIIMFFEWYLGFGINDIIFKILFDIIWYSMIYILKYNYRSFLIGVGGTTKGVCGILGLAIKPAPS